MDSGTAMTLLKILSSDKYKGVAKGAAAGDKSTLSMLFNASLRAPHGGIFVVPVVTNPIMYLVAIVVGSIVGMALLAVLKKPLDKEA